MNSLTRRYVYLSQYPGHLLAPKRMVVVLDCKTAEILTMSHDDFFDRAGQYQVMMQASQAHERCREIKVNRR